MAAVTKSREDRYTFRRPCFAMLTIIYTVSDAISDTISDVTYDVPTVAVAEPELLFTCGRVWGKLCRLVPRRPNIPQFLP